MKNKLNLTLLILALIFLSQVAIYAQQTIIIDHTSKDVSKIPPS